MWNSVMNTFQIWMWFWTIIVRVKCQQETAGDWRRVGRSELFRAINSQQYTNTNLARNIILFIGDGMGVSTVTASRIYEGQSRGRSGEENLLYFERFPYVGIMKTYNADSQVPDSAGTGTAILSGVKVNSGVIGLDSRVQKGNCSTYREDAKLPTILHRFVSEGLSTGIVSNSRITHATPASAYAHTPARSWEGDVDMVDESEDCGVDDIAKQLIMNNSDIKVLLGGGRRYFLDNSTVDPETGRIDPFQRRDGLNLINEWQRDKESKNKTNRYVWNAEGFQGVDPDKTDYLLGLFDPSHMDFDMFPANQETDQDTSLSLADLTEKAIKILRKDTNGYFLLVEGARIDWGHHANSATVALQETVELDKAVKRAVMLSDPSDTLVLVTADHSHAFAIQGYSPRGHSILGLSNPDPKNAPLDEMPYTTLAYTNGPQFGRHDLNGVDTTSNDFRQSSCIPLSVETHAGEDVVAYSLGPWAQLLHGTHEQNYLYHLMEYASCMGWCKRYCRDGERFEANNADEPVEHLNENNIDNNGDDTSDGNVDINNTNNDSVVNSYSEDIISNVPLNDNGSSVVDDHSHVHNDSNSDNHALINNSISANYIKTNGGLNDNTNSNSVNNIQPENDINHADPVNTNCVDNDDNNDDNDSENAQIMENNSSDGIGRGSSSSNRNDGRVV